MMINYEKLSLELSEFFGIEIEIGKVISTAENFEVRFKDLERDNTFSFAIYRNFSSTSIKFLPDKFGKNSLLIVEEAIVKKISDIKNFLNDNQNKIDKMEFKLGGKHIHTLQIDGSEDLSGLIYDAKNFTEESNLHLGIFNAKEIELLYFTIKLFLIFLTIKHIGYVSPDEAVGYPEGAVTIVQVNKYERSPKNRKLCIDHYGLSCLGCGFNFADFYGELGEEFIIVHHTVPVSKIGPDYVIDPSKDLIPLCANCHAIVHRKEPPLQLNELKILTNYT